jgi:hypothetical protein
MERSRFVHSFFALSLASWDIRSRLSARCVTTPARFAYQMDRYRWPWRMPGMFSPSIYTRPNSASPSREGGYKPFLSRWGTIARLLESRALSWVEVCVTTDR